MAIIGTIQEQGFVTQNSNLGFRPLTESEKKQLEKNLDKERKKVLSVDSNSNKH